MTADPYAAFDWVASGFTDDMPWSKHHGRTLVVVCFVTGWLVSVTILSAVETCNLTLLVHYVETVEKRAPSGLHVKVDDANFSPRFSRLSMV